MAFENLLKEVLSTDEMIRALHRVCEHTGSRSVVPHLVTAETDYDFMAPHTAAVVEWLKVLGFDQKLIDADYMDSATHSVWVHPFFNGQVTLKFPEKYATCQLMWSILRGNPTLFENHFWKSNKNTPLAKIVVRDRINALMDLCSLILK